MNLKLCSVLEYGIPETISILNQGFSDYIVPIHMGEEQFFNMLRFDSVDVNLSRVVFRDDQAVGVALIARRGWNCRLAGMSIIPGGRGQGVGRWLMKELIDEAKERGERRLELEVIEQNTPAVHLYQKAGFSIVRKLMSFVSEKPDGGPAEIQEIDLRMMGRMVTVHGLPDLPWQISGETLMQLGVPFKAFCSENCFVAISTPDASQISIRSILLMPEAQKVDGGSRLLRALFARYPGKTWRVPAIFPEEFGTLFKDVGFVEEDLSQLQMVINLLEQ